MQFDLIQRMIFHLNINFIMGQYIDRRELARFVEENVDYSSNPESFRYQLDQEISNHLKKEQRKLKYLKSKAKSQAILDQNGKKRQQLQNQLQQKSKKSLANRQMRMHERVKSMVQIRKRKEEYIQQKLKVNRKQELIKSLQKIKALEKDKDQVLQQKISRYSNNSKLSQSHSAQLSRLIQRNSARQAEYESLVKRLQQKGLFKKSHPLKQLFTQKAKHMRLIRQQSQKARYEKIGLSLSKIEEARNRKQLMLRQKAEKLSKEDEFQKKLKHGKQLQIAVRERQKRKKIIQKQADKVQNLIKQQDEKQILSYSNIKKSNYIEIIDQPLTKKHASYRQQIRKHIQHFLKGPSNNSKK